MSPLLVGSICLISTTAQASGLLIGHDGATATTTTVGNSTTTTGPITTTTYPVVTGNTVHVPAEPDALLQAGGDIWVASCSGNAVTEINATTKQIVQELNNPSYQFDCPDALAFAGGDIWVANQLGNSITELNPSTGALVDYITGTQIYSPVSLTVINGGYIWVGNSYTLKLPASLVKINVSNPSLNGVLTISASVQHSFAVPNNIIYTGTYLLLGESGYEFNAINGAYTRTIRWVSKNFAAYSYYYRAAIWVSGINAHSGVIGELSIPNGVLIRVFNVPSPKALIFNGSHLFVINTGFVDNLLEYGPTGKLQKTIAKSNKGDGLGFYSILLDGNNIWTINYSSNLVTVYSI